MTTVEATGWTWAEGAVDRRDSHFVLAHSERATVAAIVGRRAESECAVAFLTSDPDVRRDVAAELQVMLGEIAGPDAWTYLAYHTTTVANAMAKVTWGFVAARPSSEAEEVQERLRPLVGRAWEMHRRVGAAARGAGVAPSCPILFFGDLFAYLDAPLRVVTVGLNPSNAEFPDSDPWVRFPHLAGPERSGDDSGSQVDAYLRALSSYFQEQPYRRWFDGSFEPVLRGLGASYYAGRAVTALHTDIASPVATSPTWSKLSRDQRNLHAGGASLWLDLMEVLAPDIVIASVARSHLHVLTDQAVETWEEAARVERRNPFVVRHCSMPFAGRVVSVLFGRCVTLPFGSVSHADRERLGVEIAARTGCPR